MTQWGQNNCRRLIFNKHTVVLDGALYFNIYCYQHNGIDSKPFNIKDVTQNPFLYTVYSWI
jgi:hypothetical protein